MIRDDHFFEEGEEYESSSDKIIQSNKIIAGSLINPKENS
jgi:hypothetical protein